MSDVSQTNQLRKTSLGMASVKFLVISAAAPLTAVAGGVPIAMLLGNGSGVAAGFAIVTAILLLFSVSYVTMAQHIANAGAFYTFTAQGLGGRMGGAASMIAILSYKAMQVGVTGLLFIIIFAKFREMTGATGIAGIALPLSDVVIVAIGYYLGVKLESRDPTRFAQMGRART